ncbi:MAG: hypothetical protein K2H53_00925 [Clostridia bacterium]|nr:hypothetical protein [Clostridia bacterium]
MKKIKIKISGIVLVFVAIVVWVVCNYNEDTISMQTSTGAISRNKNRLGSKTSRKSSAARSSEKQM